MENELISVIVPIYNTEKYLRRCIDSILSQTYVNFELLLVDDGSNDCSGRICDEYAEIDHRVRAFHKENGGVSSARNMGIDNAKGVWITFVDSDDWLVDSHIKTFYLQIKQGFDLCINSFTCVQKQQNKDTVYPDFECRNKQKVINAFFTYHSVHYQFLWNKIFKLDVIKLNQIKFDESVDCGEDAIFVCSYLSCISSVSSVSQITYCYNQSDYNVLSLGRKKRDDSTWLCQISYVYNALMYLYRKTGNNSIKIKAINYKYQRFFECIFVLKCPVYIDIHRYKEVKQDLLKDDLKYINNCFVYLFWFFFTREYCVVTNVVLNLYWLKNLVLGAMKKSVVYCWFNIKNKL